MDVDSICMRPWNLINVSAFPLVPAVGHYGKKMAGLYDLDTWSVVILNSCGFSFLGGILGHSYPFGHITGLDSLVVLDFFRGKHAFTATKSVSSACKILYCKSSSYS